MSAKSTAIEAPQATTEFPRLLARVEAGEEITITRGGVEIARLVPASHKPDSRTPAQVIAHLREARRGVTLGGLSIRDLIDEGRA